MFKSLRDRLKGVSERLEDELEAKLEAELDAELAAELEKEGAVEAPDIDAAPAGADGTAPQGEGDDASGAKPAQAADTPDASGTATPGDATGSPVTEKAPSPAAASAPTEVADASPGQPERETAEDEPSEGDGAAGRGEATIEPAGGSGTVGTRPDEAPRPDDASLDRQDRSGAEPTPPTAQEATPPQDAVLQAKPAKAVAPEAPKAAKVAEKPKPQITGRKMLSTEEIEARLARELEEAVEVQKEVESVVQQSGVRVTKYTINEDVLEEILWELEIGLLESDVALPVIEAIKENVKEQLLSMSVAGKSAHDVVEKVLRTAVRRVLNIGHFDFDAFVKEKLDAGKKPVVVMFVGVNGTGKTTSIGRIAYRLKQNGISCVMAAGDTFRAGAIEQISQHGDKLGVKVVKHSAGADPAAVAYDAIEHAKARHKDVVLLDTAGRMQTNTNLMDEMDKIRRVANPDLTVFVGDSLAGNDAVEQARRFDEVVDIDGAILTKVDVDAKGGAALSVAYTINKPLLFVGVGQNYPDIRPFDAQWMVDRLFGDEGEA